MVEQVMPQGPEQGTTRTSGQLLDWGFDKFCPAGPCLSFSPSPSKSARPTNAALR